MHIALLPFNNKKKCIQSSHQCFLAEKMKHVSDEVTNTTVKVFPAEHLRKSIVIHRFVLCIKTETPVKLL